MNRRRAIAVIGRELAVYRSAKTASEIATAWVALERAHIVSQPYLGPHLAIHWTMLGFAVEQRDIREVAGQIARLALAPFGAVTGAFLPATRAGPMSVHFSRCRSRKIFFQRLTVRPNDHFVADRWFDC